MKKTIAEREHTLADPKDFIPQRFPFLFIDGILEEEERKLVAVKNVSANEAFFIGHFPNNPVMPGVLIMESLAQAAEVLVSKTAGKQDRIPVLVGSERLRFRRPVKPGDQLVLEVELVKWDGTVGKVKSCAKVGDQVAAEGNLTIKLERFLTD